MSPAKKSYKRRAVTEDELRRLIAAAARIADAPFRMKVPAVAVFPPTIVSYGMRNR